MATIPEAVRDFEEDARMLAEIDSELHDAPDELKPRYEERKFILYERMHNAVRNHPEIADHYHQELLTEHLRLEESARGLGYQATAEVRQRSLVALATDMHSNKYLEAFTILFGDAPEEADSTIGLIVNAETQEQNRGEYPKEAPAFEPVPEALYSKIAPLGFLKNNESVPTDQRITVAVTADNKININGHEIALNKHMLFMFNAVMHLRGKPISAGDIHALGFGYDVQKKTSRVAMLSQNIYKLFRKIDGAARAETITLSGNSTNRTYRVNPRLYIVDNRPDTFVFGDGDSVATAEEIGQTDHQEESRVFDPTPENLYAKLAPLGFFKNAEWPGDDAVNVFIKDDTTISINGYVLRLESHTLFLFNGLMHLRGTQIAPKDLKALGFYPDATESTAKAALSYQADRLFRLINNAAGKTLLWRAGGKSTSQYFVSPNLAITDERDNGTVAILPAKRFMRGEAGKRPESGGNDGAITPPQPEAYDERQLAKDILMLYLDSGRGDLSTDQIAYTLLHLGRGEIPPPGFRGALNRALMMLRDGLIVPGINVDFYLAVPKGEGRSNELRYTIEGLSSVAVMSWAQQQRRHVRENTAGQQKESA